MFKVMIAVAFVFWSLGAKANDCSLAAGRALSYGQIDNDYERSAVVLEKLSDAGDACASYFLGQLYWSGLGVKQDRVKALDLMQRARDNGYPAGNIVPLVEQRR
ncbi:sel1 repeat family protein [Zoogloea oleivorans]|uniref:Sel1 repeat family protein n=1 Tax=Zoogloea oleivorans TaxID=1552750 RepID=A0A6C2D8R3_9RHOO|nr:sel1 repeat family protein [Zoogloea oleivorans]TYC62075.1 sel1 repeat family protein [Zoogloea oleivorans]